MIRQLNMDSTPEVQALLDVQTQAYLLEAEWLGFDGIPYLKDTVDKLRSYPQVFCGYVDNGTLLGAISYEENDGVLEICRLVVHPNAHRQGIGRELVQWVLEERWFMSVFKVSTGVDNIAARALYHSLGFTDVTKEWLPEGVELIHMEKSGFQGFRTLSDDKPVEE